MRYSDSSPSGGVELLDRGFVTHSRPAALADARQRLTWVMENALRVLAEDRLVELSAAATFTERIIPEGAQVVDAYGRVVAAAGDVEVTVHFKAPSRWGAGV